MLGSEKGAIADGHGQDIRIMTPEPNETCELCASPGGAVLHTEPLCRVVLVADADYPAFCRVILNRHAREMTDLDSVERQRLMAVVFAVERALRETLRPDKINLASFGNMTPHVHWHVIPRWRDDRHFPQPVWGCAQRAQPARHPATPELGAAIAAALAMAAA
jgi:diadenosine tetraphosphate (Ap4A) HIT family hydrolase